ncbi:MAG: HAMP domain-containing histidine kinase [Myxococcales bacterium]|nr:HAMP domain-containing histidine kinase [Myxococcales bacterium]
MDEFLATVSHELRTPPNAILGWTSTLRGRHPPPELDRPLAIIERNARRQARLIEDVLDASRIISGKLTLNLGPTHVAEWVERAVEPVTPAGEAKQIAIRSDLDATFTMIADGDRLQQIVWHLLSNAVKFTPTGGEVDVRMQREGSEVLISVEDNGEGIPLDALPILFEPFRQADASTTRRHGGLGLGLAIVRQLAAAHEGPIASRFPWRSHPRARLDGVRAEGGRPARLQCRFSDARRQAGRARTARDDGREPRRLEPRHAQPAPLRLTGAEEARMPAGGPGEGPPRQSMHYSLSCLRSDPLRIGTFRGLAWGNFGMRIVSTPSASCALRCSSSRCSGKVKERANEP